MGYNKPSKVQEASVPEMLLRYLHHIGGTLMVAAQITSLLRHNQVQERYV